MTSVWIVGSTYVIILLCHCRNAVHQTRCFNLPRLGLRIYYLGEAEVNESQRHLISHFTDGGEGPLWGPVGLSLCLCARWVIFTSWFSVCMSRLLSGGETDPHPSPPLEWVPGLFFLITSSHHISLTFVSFSLLYWFNWLRWSPRLTLGSLLPDLSQGLEPMLCPALSLSHETGLCARNTRVRVKNVYLLFFFNYFL